MPKAWNRSIGRVKASSINHVRTVLDRLPVEYGTVSITVDMPVRIFIGGNDEGIEKIEEIETQAGLQEIVFETLPTEEVPERSRGSLTLRVEPEEHVEYNVHCVQGAPKTLNCALLEGE